MVQVDISVRPKGRYSLCNPFLMQHFSEHHCNCKFFNNSIRVENQQFSSIPKECPKSSTSGCPKPEHLPQVTYRGYDVTSHFLRIYEEKWRKNESPETYLRGQRPERIELKQDRVGGGRWAVGGPALS